MRMMRREGKEIDRLENGSVMFKGVKEVVVSEANEELGQAFKKERSLVHSGGAHDAHKNAPSHAVRVKNHAHHLFQMRLNVRAHRHLGAGDVLLLPALEPVPHDALNEGALGALEAVREGGDDVAEAALDLVHAGGEEVGGVAPREGYLPGTVGEGEGEVAAGVVLVSVGGGLLVEEGADEVGEEEGVEVGKPEERFFEGVTPVLREELGGV